MTLRRRRFLALASAGAAPALAGCTPCGETWTGVGFDVAPLAVDGEDGWRVDARLTVEFDFGREGYGLAAAAMALVDAEGAVLAESDAGDLRWSDVPADRREETDCGDHATVTREATLRSGAFPRWIGLRYDRFRSSYDSPTRVARYPSATPGGSVGPSDYERVALAAAAVDDTPVDPDPPMTDVRFDAGPLGCAERTPAAEARTNVFLVLEGDRAVPAEHYHPVLVDLSLAGDELAVTTGLRTAPRFRRGGCLRSRWSAGVDFEEPADVPATVRVRHLDRDGEEAATRRLEVRRESA